MPLLLGLQVLPHPLLKRLEGLALGRTWLACQAGLLVLDRFEALAKAFRQLLLHNVVAEH